MAIVLITMGNAAMNGAENVASPTGAVSAWNLTGIAGIVTAGAALLLSIAAVVLAVRLKAFMDQGPGTQVAFAEALRADVREHSRRIAERFLAKTGAAPDSLESLRAHLRSLRHELSEPMAYLGRMATVPVGDFPGHDLSSAFGAWAGAVRGLHEAVDNYYRDTSYAGEEIGIRRENYLLRQYATELAHLLELRAKVKDTAAKVDKLAGAYIARHKPKTGTPSPPPPAAGD